MQNLLDRKNKTVDKNVRFHKNSPLIILIKSSSSPFNFRDYPIPLIKKQKGLRLDETKTCNVSTNIFRDICPAAPPPSSGEQRTYIATIRRTVKTQLPAHPRASTPPHPTPPAPLDRPRPYRAVKIDNARGKSPRS